MLRRLHALRRAAGLVSWTLILPSILPLCSTTEKARDPTRDGHFAPTNSSDSILHDGFAVLGRAAP
jgi:hypothetical protein